MNGLGPHRVTLPAIPGDLLGVPSINLGGRRGGAFFQGNSSRDVRGVSSRYGLKRGFQCLLTLGCAEPEDEVAGGPRLRFEHLRLETAVCAT